MSIGLAAVVLLAIGILGALILVLAAHFLHVPEDERVGLVQACLPGANCGLCRLCQGDCGRRTGE